VWKTPDRYICRNKEKTAKSKEEIPPNRGGCKKGKGGGYDPTHVYQRKTGAERGRKKIGDRDLRDS